METKPLIFISYSHQDEQEKNILMSHLRVLENLSLVSFWDSTEKIVAGDDWAAKIDQAINQAKIAVLLISPGYLTSSFLIEKEAPNILDRKAQGGTFVVPVIIKPCPWTEVDWLAKMQVLPRNGKPIWDEKGNVDDKIAGVVNEITDILLAVSKEEPFIERDFVPEVTTVKSGGANLIASGTAIQFGNNPIEIYFGSEPIKFIFSFSGEKSQRETPVTAELIDHKTVSLTIFESQSPLLPKGTVKPFPLGVFNNRRLYLHFRVRDFPGGDNTLEYNIYLGEEVNQK